MEKYVTNLDLCEVYEEANKMIYSALAKVDPATEYHTFIHQNKRYVCSDTLFVCSVYRIAQGQ